MEGHLLPKIRELEIVVAVPGRMREIVAAAVQTVEDTVVGIVADVEDRCFAMAAHWDMNAHGEEGGFP